MKIQQNGIILILTVDVNPLLRAVDIDIHALIDAARGYLVVVLHPDGADAEQYQNQTDHQCKDDQQHCCNRIQSGYQHEGTR